MQLKIKIKGKIITSLLVLVKIDFIEGVINHCLEREIYPHAEAGQNDWLKRICSDDIHFSELFDCFVDTIPYYSGIDDASTDWRKYEKDHVCWKPTRMTYLIDGGRESKIDIGKVVTEIDELIIEEKLFYMGFDELLMHSGVESDFNETFSYVWNNINEDFKSEKLKIELVKYDSITDRRDLRISSVTYNGSACDRDDLTGFSGSEIAPVFLRKSGKRYSLQELITEYINKL